MDELPKKIVSNEEAQATVRWTGIVIFAVCAGAAYFFFPTGVGSIPLSQLTLGMIGEAIGCVVVFLIGLSVAVMFWD